MPNQNPPYLCPICKENADFKFIQDYKNEGREWSLYECPECQVQFWMPFRNPGEEWYKSLAGYVVRDIARPKIVRGYHKQFLKKYKNFSKGKRILDLGCGAGELLVALQKRGCEVWGVDFDKNAIETAEKYFNLKNVYAMSFDDFFKLPNLPKFDVVTFFEVIEHIDNPLEFIQNVKNLLKEDSTIILSTPSRERILVNSIKADFPYHHLTRWNEKAISNLFKKINFKIVRVDYVEQFQFILDALSERFRFGLVKKTIKVSQGQEDIVPKATVFTRIVHLGSHLKDYLLCGIPATILFLIGKLKGQKNGDMLIWLKKKK